MFKPGAFTVSEAMHRGSDPACGAEVWQLTGAPLLSSNIYCEMPFVDGASRYVILQRSARAEGGWEVWRADLHTRKLTMVAQNTAWTSGCAMSTNQQYFYCVRHDPGAGTLEILRTDIVSLDQQATVFSGVTHRLSSMGALSWDMRWYYASTRRGAFADHRFGIGRFDLQTGQWEVIHERGDDLCNAHVQIDLCTGEDLLIQHNRGAVLDDAGNVVKLVAEPFATLYVIRTDGSHLRELPVGKPFTDPCQGHQCWIPGRSEVLLTVSGGREKAVSEGNLYRVQVGAEQAQLVARGAYFCHPNVSRDGRFFVADTQPDKDIVVGSLQTGRWAVLCRSRSSFTGPQWTHPHPYFTPDNRWVIFNSDLEVGLPNVFATQVPEGLLEGLEDDSPPA